MMKVTTALLAVALSAQATRADVVAPTGTLRAIYLASNPAQAVRDASGEVRGAAIDLARDLAKRRNLPVTLIPGANPAAVIEAVAKGEADIGFVAFAPERVGTVLFSQVYMLVQQSFIVKEASPIRSVSDIDAGGMRIAGGQGDSVTLYMKRNLKAAKLVETDNTPADMKQKFASGDIDAFGANRQRLTTLLKDMPNYRLLPDNLFGVPQTIVVGKDKTEALAAIDSFIDEARSSGALSRSLSASGIVGIEVAPPGHRLDR